MLNKENNDINYKQLYNNFQGFMFKCIVMPPDKQGLYNFILDIVNENCFELIGIHAEEAISARCNILEKITVHDDLYKSRLEITKCIKEHRQYVVHYRIIPPHTKVIKWVREQGKTFYDDNGVPLYIEGAITDFDNEKLNELRLENENRLLRASCEQEPGSFIGQSKVMRKLYGQLNVAASTNTSIILYGETGSGKDLAARTIHKMSQRQGAYVPVNCGAIPEQLMESEFFGHVKGAFSGAYAPKTGYIGAADGGTLFLDEIGELPPQLQVTLLRAIENKSYTPVGSHISKLSDFRLISATNQNLRELVDNHQMRLDFYYRVHVLSIVIPSLRDRIEDLPLLIHEWLQHRGHTVRFPANVYRTMEQYSWPGNIRELHNFLDRYLVFGESAIESIEHAEHPQPIQTIPIDKLKLKPAVASFEKEHILAVLEQFNWRMPEVCDALGLQIRTLQRKMKQLGICRKV